MKLVLGGPAAIYVSGVLEPIAYALEAEIEIPGARFDFTPTRAIAWPPEIEIEIASAVDALRRFARSIDRHAERTARANRLPWRRRSAHRRRRQGR